MFSLIKYYFSNTRTLHRKPKRSVYLNREVLVLFIILAVCFIGAVALALSEGPHYYMISQGV